MQVFSYPHHLIRGESLTLVCRDVKVLKAKGMKIFIRINHGENAKNVGQNLRPTELIIS